MTYSVRLGGQPSDSEGASPENVREAIRALLEGTTDVLVVHDNGDPGGSTYLSLERDEVDGFLVAWESDQGRIFVADASADVSADDVSELVRVWLVREEGWQAKDPWEEFEEESDEGPRTSALASVIAGDWSHEFAQDEDGNLVLYVDPTNAPIAGAKDLPDVDLLHDRSHRGVLLALPDGTLATVQKLLSETTRTFIDTLVAHPEFRGSRWPDFAAEHGLDYDIPDDEAEIDVHRAVYEIYRRRVGDELEARIDEVAARVVRHPTFDPLDEDLHLRLVRELAPDSDDHFVEEAHNAVWALVHENGMVEQAEGDLGVFARAFFAGLTTRQVDLLSYAQWDLREAQVSTAHPHLTRAQLNTVAHHLRDLLRAGEAERKLRFGTVARALLQSGMSKRDVADTLGVKQVQVSNTIRDSPEEVSLAPDDYLRGLVDGIARLDESLPSVTHALSERASARAESKQAVNEAKSEIPVLAAEMLAGLDRRTTDRYALMAHADREAIVAASYPELHPAVVELVVAHINYLFRQIDATDCQARYATAIRALTRKGATRAAAARYLGISPRWVGGVIRTAPQDVNLGDEDYLRELVAQFPPAGRK